MRRSRQVPGPTGTFKPTPFLDGIMADSWKSAKEEAAQKAYPFVCHDLERGTFGAAKREDDCGHFSTGRWVPHRAICVKAELGAEEMEAEEAAYLAEHPEARSPTGT